MYIFCNILITFISYISINVIEILYKLFVDKDFYDKIRFIIR